MHSSSNPERLSIIQPCHRGSKNNISKSLCQKEKEKEENATEITPFRVSSSKSKNEWLNSAKGSLLHPARKRQDTVTSLLPCPSSNTPQVCDGIFPTLFSVTPGACRKVHSSFANIFTNIFWSLKKQSII